MRKGKAKKARASGKAKAEASGKATAETEARAPGKAEARTEDERKEAMNAKQVLEMVKSNGVRIVDMRFCDFVGVWQHFSVPAHTLTADVFEEGLRLAGSSLLSW